MVLAPLMSALLAQRAADLLQLLCAAHRINVSAMIKK